MQQAVWDANNRDVRCNDVQKLAGNVYFWATVAPALHLVLPAIWAMTGGASHEWARPAGPADIHECMWREFFEAVEFVRLMVLQRDCWSTSFVSPLAFALSPGEIMGLPGGWPHVWLGGDASGSDGGDVLAGIDVEAGTWHAEHMGVFAGALGAVCGEEFGGMTAEEFIIFVKELMALAALVVQHGDRWRHKVVCAAWDNMNVVQVLKTRRSKNRYVRYLLAIIMRCEVEKGFILLGFYINTHHNHPADDISREFGPLLAELGYDGAVLAMQEILNRNTKWRHLRHEPMTDVLRFLSNSQHALHSFTLPHEADDPNALAYELAQARAETSPWRDGRLRGSSSAAGPLTVPPGTVAVVDVRAGLGMLAGEAEAAGARVHALLETDPVARDVLRARFPRALLCATVDEIPALPGCEETSVIITATVASSFAASSTAAQVPRWLRQFGASSLVITVLEPGNAWAAKLLETLNEEASGVGFHPAARMEMVDAAALGAAQDQTVGLLVFSKVLIPPDALSQYAVSPADLLHVLRPVGEVPEDCVVAGTLEAWPHRSARHTSPAVVGRLLMGGAFARLFKGSIIKVAGSHLRWRVLMLDEGEDIELVACRGAERRTVKMNEIAKHLPQWAQVISLHGTAFPVAVGGKGPAGPGNNLVLDDRMSPHRVRSLLVDEICRLQGHPQVVIDELGRLLPHDSAQQARLAGRGPARAAAAVAVQRVLETSAPERLSDGPDRKRASAVVNIDRCSGGPQRHTRANIRVGLAGEAALQAAEARLLENQITSGTRTVYERGFNYFRVWCAWRGLPFLLQGGSQARAEENELIKFVAYFGVVCEYAYATVHTWLHGIQHAHILHGLGDPLAGKLRLRLCRQGLKRLDKKRRGRTNKTAATIGLLSELVNGSGMDYTKWDDTVLATAALFGFYKLRRSGEFLRKDGVLLANKDTCVLVGDTRLLKDGVELAWNDPRALEADELLARQRFSKADQAGLGATTNTCALHDEALCVVAWVKRMLRLKPGHFQNPANFLFTVSDGKALSSGKMAQALKSAAGRLGLREEEVNVISLRSGGATAMYHAGFSVEAIQRRGRWASGCWKIYVQDARDTAKDVAERMAAASVTLL